MATLTEVRGCCKRTRDKIKTVYSRRSLGGNEGIWDTLLEVIIEVMASCFRQGTALDEFMRQARSPGPFERVAVNVRLRRHGFRGRDLDTARESLIEVAGEATDQDFELMEQAARMTSNE